ncbi:cysteine rich repeat-containing protein [Falsiroseomonas sp.]|uniref:cysteine rich repeat-containing protein n=1 Tax=Falsiroseomonas sp. TaxID=2870721 RepID=UPI003F7172B9
MSRKLILAALLAAATALPAAAQQGPQQRALMQACGADYRAHCANTPRGEGRILACLRQNSAQLSQPCRDALSRLPSR